MELNYEALVTDYNESMNSKMRGFRASENFLETWVPDDDINISILNLMEAAQNFGQKDIKVYLQGENAQQLNLAKLKEMSQSIGDISTQTNGSGCYVIIANRVDEEQAAKAASSELVQGPSVYRLKLGSLAGNRALGYEGKLEEKAGLVLVQASSGKATLSLLVDPQVHAIAAAKHTGGVSPEEKSLLDLFCECIDGLKILEASDHAVINLEYMLRDDKLQRPVKGVVIPKNADPVFKLPLDLIRSALAIYREKANYKATANFFDSRPAKEWLQLSKEEKLQKLEKVKNDYLDKRGLPHDCLTIRSIDQHSKINMSFSQDSSVANKGDVLMKLELALKDHCDAKIEVFMEEWRDKTGTRTFRNIIAEETIQ